MCPLKQKELTPDSVLRMSEQICENCTEVSACKKYLQWLRLNPVKVINNKNHLDFTDVPVFDRPYYRTQSEERFW